MKMKWKKLNNGKIRYKNDTSENYDMNVKNFKYYVCRQFGDRTENDMKKQNRKMKYAFCYLITAIFTTTSLALPINATVEDERQNLSNLQNNKQNVQQIINDLEKDKSDIQTYINKLDTEVSSISTQLYKTEQNLSDVEKKIDKNEKKLKEAQDSIGVQYDDMKLRIQYMYENGDTEMMNLILGSDSISDFLNKAEYISEISAYDRKMLNKLKSTKQTIETTQKTLTNQKTRLTALKEEQKQKKSDVEKLVEAKQSEMSEYMKKIAANEGELDKLNTEIGNQENLINEMESMEAKRRAEEESRQKAAASNKATSKPQNNSDKVPSTTKVAQNTENETKNNTGNTTSNNGNAKPSNSGTGSKPENTKPDTSSGGGTSSSGFTWPLPGHTTLSSEFGWRSDPFSGQKTFHKGLDIPAPSGTTIVAAASGTVVWSNLNPTAGNWIGIDHGNGVYTVYMHMSARLVSAGQQVSKGQTIGLVGTTGSSNGNHLHFSVRVNGVDVNPHNYVG